MAINAEDASRMYAERMAQCAYDARNGRQFCAGKAFGQAQAFLPIIGNRTLQDRALCLLSSMDHVLKTAEISRGDTVKTYIVYVDGVEVGLIKAGSHNAAERKAQKKHPGKAVSVAYTEV